MCRIILQTVILILVILCTDSFSKNLDKVENLISKYSIEDIVGFIMDESKDNSITVQVNNKLYLKSGSPNLKYITKHSIYNDLERLNLSSLEIIEDRLLKYLLNPILIIFDEQKLKQNAKIEQCSIKSLNNSDLEISLDFNKTSCVNVFRILNTVIDLDEEKFSVDEKVKEIPITLKLDESTPIYKIVEKILTDYKLTTIKDNEKIKIITKEDFERMKLISILSRLRDKEISYLQAYDSLTSSGINIHQARQLLHQPKIVEKNSYVENSSRTNYLERPIGTILLLYYDHDPILNDIKSLNQIDNSATAWQIVTTNNLVKGYYGFIELDSGNIIGGKNTIDKGTYNPSNGLLVLEHHYFKYENIHEGFTIIKNELKITSDNKVYGKSGKCIGIFYPNEFFLNSNQEIPNNQGCKDIWGNSTKKVYYTKDSNFFNNFPSSDQVIFFCNEEEAINKGYKKSIL